MVLHPDLPDITADPDLLRQVFTNIVQNAYDAMPRGGKLTVTTAQKDDGYVEVRVTDTGVGIPTVLCGPGSIDQAHTANEFITVDQLKKGVQVFKKVINKVCL